MNETINTKKHTKSKIDTITRIFVSYGELVVPLPIIGFKIGICLATAIGRIWCDQSSQVPFKVKVSILKCEIMPHHKPKINKPSNVNKCVPETGINKAKIAETTKAKIRIDNFVGAFGCLKLILFFVFFIVSH